MALPGLRKFANVANDAIGAALSREGSRLKGKIHQ
jgi:hypothetical protein